jgi:hypothetical protein
MPRGGRWVIYRSDVHPGDSAINITPTPIRLAAGRRLIDFDSNPRKSYNRVWRFLWVEPTLRGADTALDRILTVDDVTIEQWIGYVFAPNHIESPCLAAGRVGALAGTPRRGVRLRCPGDRRASGLRPIPCLRLPSTSITSRRAPCCDPLLLSASRLGR